VTERYQFIRDNTKRFPVRLMCRTLRVQAAGYYVWLRRDPGRRQIRRLRLVEQIRVVHACSRGTYGSPRVHRELLARGVSVCQNTVARIMRDQQIRSKVKRRFRPRTTDSDHDHPVAANLLERDFAPPALDQVWAADLTYVPTDQGWLYLAVVMDLCSRKIVGWATADHLRAELTIQALHMALQRRRPAPGHGLMHHSDRGVQYACNAYQEVLSDHGIVCSMSRKGNCYDNAPVESFFGTFKRELIHHQRYITRVQAAASIQEYIAIFYNRQRRHSAIGFVSPETFEASLN
jgi:transposase InsO family protein